MKYFRFTQPQIGIWETERFFEGTSIGTIGGTLLINEDLDFELWEKAINKFLEKNDSVRLRIKVIDGQPVQYLMDYQYNKLEFVDLTGKTKDEQDSWISNKMEIPFEKADSDLFEFVMLKAWNGEHGYFIKFHHAIADGWTISLLGTQTMEYYRQIKDFTALSDEAKPSYIEYIKSEQEYLNSAKSQKDREYWLNKFKDRPNISAIKIRNKDFYSSKANRLTFKVDGEEAIDLRNYCKKYSTSPAVLFEAALSIYISRFLDIQDILIGTLVLNRSGVREKATTGMFVSTVPMKIQIDDFGSFNDLCKRISAEHMSVFRHQRYPYNLILSEVRQKHKITENLFDITVSYQNAKISKSKVGYDFKTNWYFNGHLSEQLQLHIDDRDDSGVFVLHYDYLTELFTEDEINNLHKRISLLLAQGINYEDIKICEMELVDEKERHQLLYEFNDTYADYPRDKCIHQLFEEQVERSPDNIAVVFGNTKFTYQEINRKANALAKMIRNKNEKTKGVVGLMLNRSENILITQLGILKSGANYLPIDPLYPEERVNYMLQDSCASVVITSRDSLKKFKSGIAVNIVYIEDIEFEGPVVENFENINTPNDTAYLIYTSGSSGKPKGTIITHRGAVNFCNNNNIYTGIISETLIRFVSVTTISFDIFVTESLLPLINGLTVVMANEDEQNNQIMLNQLIIKNEVEILQTTPTRMKLLLADKDNLQYLQKLKVIILGGETFPVSLYRQLNELTKAKIFNIYGPTEATVWSTKAELVSENITIGKPISNTQIFILDKYLKPVPVGENGDIYIGGDGLAAGYYKRPELTEEMFIENPYSKSSKIYRTRDIGYWRDNGEIVHLGRSDFQVKIRGIRIELGEIEDAIHKSGFVEQTVVSANLDKQGNLYLCAYYVSSEGICINDMRSFLNKSLPEYMIPTYFLRMESIPLSPNWKVDRKALPAPILEEIRTKEYAAPRNELERKLADILCGLFEAESISIDDHFFHDLGGNSFTIIRYQTLAETQDICIKTKEVFEYPTIRLLSANLGGQVVETLNDDRNYGRISNSFRCFTNKNKMKNVFLTGATGYLGAHLLSQLMENTEVEIICLVRDENRFIDSLKYYFGDTYRKEIGKRIILIVGNLNKPQFGLNFEEYEELLQSVDTVIHAAANVRHFGIWDEFYKTNVLGTKEIIAFSLKSNSKLHHISTTTVSGDGLVKQNRNNPLFDEDSLFIGQDYKSNVYIHSKYLAEKEVIDALDNGLDACIYRVGNVMWRDCDGVFQQNAKENGFINRIAAFKKLNAVPYALLLKMIDFTPVDRCAEAIIKLVRTTDKCEIYHIFNDNQISYRKMLKMANIDYRMKSFKGFVKLANADMQDENIGVLNLYLNEIKEYMNKMSVHVENKKTREALARVGFVWNKPDKNYFDKFFKTYGKYSLIHFLNPSEYCASYFSNAEL
ncbi:non-ribosomal peptide synthetase family protein [Desulfosporosinus fructosivorans]